MATVFYRQTFLRRHVSRELASTRDVMALEELKKRCPGAPVFLQDFFYGRPAQGLEALYEPIQLRPLTPRGSELAAAYFHAALPGQAPAQRPTLDLTHFLLALVAGGFPGGVVLNARSGAGKTAACLAAFCDCFLGPRPGEALSPSGPRLAGFLPCRAPVADDRLPFYKPIHSRLNEAMSEAERKARLIEALKSVDEQPILQLLLAAAGYEEADVSRLRSWLRYGPPLLLFCDLNTAGDLERHILAVALVKFQQNPDHQKAGHRCIVTYRSATHDGVVEQLEHSGHFLVCDLKPLDDAQVERYLSQLRSYESRLTGKEYPKGKRQRELRHLWTVLARFNEGESPLTTSPLLLHLISVLRGEQLEKVHTLSDLYRYVIEEYYRRDYKDQQTQLSQVAGNPYERFLVAMIRPALAMLSSGPDHTRLTGQGDVAGHQVLRELWQEPGEPATGTGVLWHPTLDHDFWSQGPYYGGSKAYKFGDDEIDRFKKRTLLHSERNDSGNQNNVAYGFLHDSFVYYFAALALRYWATPLQDHQKNRLNSGKGEEWYSAAAARLHACPQTWAPAAVFLGGMLTEPQAVRLLAAMASRPAVKSWAVVASQLVRGVYSAGDHVLSSLDHALRRPTAHSWPEALFSVCYHAVPQADVFQQQAKDLQRWWLMNQSPEPRREPQALAHFHFGPVQSVFSPRRGSRIVALGGGLARCWDSQRGEAFDIGPKGALVTAVAVLWEQKQAVLGCADGRIERRVLDPARPSETIYQTSGPVKALVEWTLGPGVVASLADGGIWLLGLDGNAELLAEHRGPPPSQLRLLPGGSLVFADETGAVGWLAPMRPRARARAKPDLYHHRRPVTHLAAVADGDKICVVFADSEGEVFLLTRIAASGPEWGMPRSLKAPPGRIRGLGICDNEVVLLNADGSIHLLSCVQCPDLEWTPSSGRLAFTENEALVGEDNGTVRAVPRAVQRGTLPDVETSPIRLVAGTPEWTIICKGSSVVFQAADAGKTREYGCPDTVTQLLMPEGWKHVVIGSASGHLILWDTDSGRLMRAVQGLRGAVAVLARLQGDGERFVCGGAAGGVVFLSASDLAARGTEAVNPIRILPSPVTAVLPVGLDEVLVGCRNGVVYRVGSFDLAAPRRCSFKVVASPLNRGGAVIGLIRLTGDRWLTGYAGGALAVLCSQSVDPLWSVTIPPVELLVEESPRPSFIAGCQDGRVWFGRTTASSFDREWSQATQRHLGPVCHIAPHPSQSLAATASTDRMILLWDTDKRCLIDACEAPETVTALAWLSDESLAVGGQSGALSLLDLRGRAS